MQQPRRHASHSVTNPATMSVVTLRGRSRQPPSLRSVDNAIKVASNPANRHTIGRSFGAGVASRRPNVVAPPVSTRGMRWTTRKTDDPALRRIPVPGRRSRLRAGVARVPRRHRHHQRVVVVDALAVPVCGGGLAVDGDAEGCVPEDDGVGR